MSELRNQWKTYNNFSRVVLRGIGNDSIFNDHCIPSQPIVVCPTVALGEFAFVIREEKNIVSFDTVGLSPGSHHVGIVRGYHRNDLHTFPLQYVKVLDVRRKMLFGAARSESTFQLICQCIPLIK